MGFLISPLGENQTLSFAGQTRTSMQIILWSMPCVYSHCSSFPRVK